MIFAHPALLWLLAIPAALLIWHRARERWAALARSFPRAIRVEAGPNSLRPTQSDRPTPRPFLSALALTLGVLALARPQGEIVHEPGLVRARDVLVAVDVSRSMLATDVPPSRLERARILIRSLADELRGERLGLAPFAGSAFLLCPLSADYSIFRTFLDELGPDMIPLGGSDFTALLRVANQAFGFDDPKTPPPAADRYLIILSDGEAHDDTWREPARHLGRNGVRVIALGLGTPAGALVPAPDGSITKDARGAAVLSRLNPETLRELAALTDGTYRDASAWVDLPALLRETIARGRAIEVATTGTMRRRELFPWFLAPALACLLGALLREIPTPVRPRKIAPAALALALALATPQTPIRAEPITNANPIASLVERLAATPQPDARDYAALADLTAAIGEKNLSTGRPLAPGVVKDALEAVRHGERLNPRAADWASLRTRLEALLQEPETARPPEPDPTQNQEKPDPQAGPKNNPSEASQPGESEQPNQPASPPQSEALGELDKPNDKSGETPTSEHAPASTQLSDRPPQQAGGVSAEDRNDADREALAKNPALALPLQNLDRLRAADSPARLFQLLQQAEEDSEQRTRRAAGPARDW